MKTDRFISEQMVIVTEFSFKCERHVGLAWRHAKENLFRSQKKRLQKEEKV